MGNKKLSIITINYNNASGLKRTLASVAAQTYRDIEHIVIDGGSTDGSVEVIKDYVDRVYGVKCTVYWISEKDSGIYNAMNKGLEIALGRRVVNDDHTSSLKEHHTSHIRHQTSEQRDCDYIQILNSGDILAAPDVTERMFTALESYAVHHTPYTENGAAILYGNMIKEWPNGKRYKDTCGSDLYTPESFLYFYKGTLNHDCAYIRRDLFEKYGLYNEEMKICSDWEWYVRAIVLGGEKAVYTNIDVTIFDMTGVSESDGKNAELIQRERREYLEKILPSAVLRDYDQFAFPVLQYQRLKKYHLWGVVYFMERVLFKLEKWGVLRG